MRTLQLGMTVRQYLLWEITLTGLAKGYYIIY